MGTGGERGDENAAAARDRSDPAAVDIDAAPNPCDIFITSDIVGRFVTRGRSPRLI